MCGYPKLKALAVCALIAPLTLAASWVFAAETTTSQKKDQQVQKVYKTVGPNGEVIYSDKPSPGSEEVTVPVGDGYTPAPPPASFTPYQAPSKAATNNSIDNSITITSPTNKESIWSGPGKITISVSLGSDLGADQTLEYQVDGKTVYTGTATSHSVDNIYRGTHVLVVRIKDESGGSIESQPVTIYMKRPFIRKQTPPKIKKSPQSP